ncbi:MAG: 30S ribosomal protein S12 methylthiotransferase RimO [Desulfovibrionaceae bacterium]
MLKVYSVSLGCPKNRVDTEHLLGSLGLAVRPVDKLGHAQVVLINTCGFIQPAVEESVRTIMDAVRHRESLKRRPLLVVAGCMVGRYGVPELAAELPEVDLWLPNDNLAQWPSLLCRALGLGAAVPGRLLSTGPSYAWLKISDGCRHACSFCTIPSIRGRHRSTPAEVLVPEAQQLLDAGVKELVLVAQDVTAWGEDLPTRGGKAQNLVSLLEQILPLRGLARLRLLYLYPAGITTELLHFMRQAGPSMLPYFDVPVQHAHDAILSRMGRPFARDPRVVLNRIREVLPEAALRTSLIVGFPGETEQHFAALQAFVDDMCFAHLGVFAYRAEEGTPAADMPDQVEDAVKEWRRDSIMEQQADISAAFLAQFDGQRLSILVDAPHPEWPGLHVGRAWFQAPEIDGLTYISGPGVRPGALVDADIVETHDYDLNALT